MTEESVEPVRPSMHWAPPELGGQMVGVLRIVEADGRLELRISSPNKPSARVPLLVVAAAGMTGAVVLGAFAVSADLPIYFTLVLTGGLMLQAAFGVGLALLLSRWSYHASVDKGVIVVETEAPFLDVEDKVVDLRRHPPVLTESWLSGYVIRFKGHVDPKTGLDTNLFGPVKLNREECLWLIDLIVSRAESQVAAGVSS